MDIMIHIVLEYGLGESFIYAGHWLFTFPILFGWLIKSQKKIMGQIITFILLAFALITAGNNIIKFYEIYNNFGLYYFGTT
jgi:hypothetical protein